MKQTITTKQLWATGLMLFALFLGAGNIIFPPYLGQQAGENLFSAVCGFLVTGVGLPLLAVIAVGRTGTLQTIAGRVHPSFGAVFTIIVYMAIGPFFGIPRTATVTYEVGVLPFLSENASGSGLALFITSVLFFGITAWLALNPGKLIDRIGKIITPVLLIVLIVLVGKNVFYPIGPIVSGTLDYAGTATSFFNGFMEGYLTMDTIGGLVFGTVVISSIRNLGIENKADITKVVSKAGIIAAIGLILVYIPLTYIGATSVTEIGMLDNGGAILAASAKYLYGFFGIVVLAFAITLACLTTSVGLISACSEFFAEYIPALSYKKIVCLLAIFSTCVANVGLSALISISLPILNFLYPIAITLIILTFCEKFFNRSPFVYIGAVTAAGIISLFEVMASFGIGGAASDLVAMMPFAEYGISWFIPALIGGLIGYFTTLLAGAKEKADPFDLDLD